MHTSDNFYVGMWELQKYDVLHSPRLVLSTVTVPLYLYSTSTINTTIDIIIVIPRLELELTHLQRLQLVLFHGSSHIGYIGAGLLRTAFTCWSSCLHVCHKNSTAATRQ